MDLKLKDAVFNSTLPHVPTLVMLALSNCIYQTGDICNPSIATLVRLTRLSRITILRTLSELKRRGIVSVSKRARGRKGEANVYEIADEKLSTGTENVGVSQKPNPARAGILQKPNPAKVGISQKPNPAKVGISQKPERNIVENIGGERSTHTHTNSNSDDVFVLADGVSISAQDIARKSRLDLRFVKDTLSELEARGWATTKGIQITRKNIQAQLRAWWSNPLTDQTKYINPKGEAGAVQEWTVADWQMCREDCANCKADGCGAGVTIPPTKDKPEYPPNECKKFKPTKYYKDRMEGKAK